MESRTPEPDPDAITFPSGFSIEQPLDRASRFLAEEFAWYDAFEDHTPDAVIPFDLLVAVGVNAFIGGAGVAKLRAIHQEMANRCNDLLAAIPASASLAQLDDLSGLVDLIIAGTYAPGALSAVVTEVLHRKRRQLIPILDSVMVKTYCSEREARVLADSYSSASSCRSAAAAVLTAIQTDVRGASNDLDQLSEALSARGWPVSTLRIHDILVWTEQEDRGHYRPLSPSRSTF